MTRSQFEAELYQIRENRRVMRSILHSLESLGEDTISSIFSGAIDYSKDRLQSTADPDGKMVNALFKLDKDVEHLKKKLDRLKEENEHVEALIYQADGLGAEIMRLFFIEGMAMPKVSMRLNYAKSSCWREMRKKITELYEQEVKNERNA